MLEVRNPKLGHTQVPPGVLDSKWHRDNRWQLQTCQRNILHLHSKTCQLKFNAQYNVESWWRPGVTFLLTLSLASQNHTQSTACLGRMYWRSSTLFFPLNFLTIYFSASSLFPHRGCCILNATHTQRLPTWYKPAFCVTLGVADRVLHWAAVSMTHQPSRFQIIHNSEHRNSCCHWRCVPAGARL